MEGHKLLSNRALDTSGAPRSAWFLALKYICMLLNHVARESLNWRTPTEWLLGYTPDITVFLVFVFWEGVYYKEVEPTFGNTPEKFRRFAVISDGVGHSMTFVVYVESGDLIHRSALRSARHGGPYRNITAEKLAPSIAPKVRIETLKDETNYNLPDSVIRGPETLVETVEEESPMTEDINVNAIDMFGTPEANPDQDDSEESSNNTVDEISQHGPLDPDTAAIHSGIEAYIRAGGTLPTMDVSDLLGRTFISEPDENGEQMRAKIGGIETTEGSTNDDTQRLYKFKCEVKDKVFEEILTYNWMLDWVDCDHHKDDMFAFESIKAHCLHPDPMGEKNMGLDIAPRGSYQLLVDWASGETSWVNYQIIFKDDPVSVSLCAQRNGLLSTPGWKNCKRYIRNVKVLARMANQVKLRSHRVRPSTSMGTDPEKP